MLPCLVPTLVGRGIHLLRARHETRAAAEASYPSAGHAGTARDSQLVISQLFDPLGYSTPTPFGAQVEPRGPGQCTPR